MRETRDLLSLGTLSAVLYAIIYRAQRAIFLNGLALEHGGVLARGDPADTGRLVVELLIYFGAVAGLLALYFRLLARVRRGAFTAGRARALALLLPVLFNAGLLLGRPHLSIDVFSYIAQGTIGVSGGNPAVQPASDVMALPRGPELVGFGWRPVHGVPPYGPLWTRFEVTVAQVTGDVRTAVFLIKLTVTLASLGGAALIWVTLARVRPDARLLGTLAYLWNPLIVIEFAGEGHNDGPMIFFVLAGVALAVHTRPAASALGLLLGALTKILPIIFLPAQLLYTWRISERRVAATVYAGFGVAAGVVVAALLYYPFWVGLQTIAAVRQAGRPSQLGSLAGLLVDALNLTGQAEGAVSLLLRLPTVAFAACYLRETVRVRDAHTLLQACGRIALLYLLLASPGYWPWYPALPVALLALSPSTPTLWIIGVLTVCSRVVAPLDVMAVNGFLSFPFAVWTSTLVGLVVPLLLVLALARRTGLQRLATS